MICQCKESLRELTAKYHIHTAQQYNNDNFIAIYIINLTVIIYVFIYTV